jgi:carboxyl-terminal processing protease
LIRRLSTAAAYTVVALTLLAGNTALHAAAPSDAVLAELRAVLAEDLARAVPAEALAALGGEDFAVRLRAIDPHALWLPADAAEHAPANGWSGIGADLHISADGVRLLPYQGGPAVVAGVPDGARLLAVDAEPVDALSPDAIAERLRGDAGTRVRLTIGEAGGARRSVAIERAALRPLDVERIDGVRPLLRVREFRAGLTRPALLASLAVEASTADAPALVIDLRHSSGGDLFEAFDVAGLFVPAGTLLGRLHGRTGPARALRAPAGDKLDMPLVLLVGPGTASAAELFAGSLQALGRATLVGQPTYGKCSSQTTVRLRDGSRLRYTNLMVELPQAGACHGSGLRPDVPVAPAALYDGDAVGVALDAAAAR